MMLLKSKILLLLLSLGGCATSQYRVLAERERTAELIVSSSRILLQCEWLYDADNPTLYGFMMHVLDNENTVFTLIQGNTLAKEDCEDRLRDIGKILRDGRHIYIAGRGHLSTPREKGRTYEFPGLGAFPGNGRILEFANIANEHGACYEAHYGAVLPCPREPFPTVKGPGLNSKFRK